MTPTTSEAQKCVCDKESDHFLCGREFVAGIVRYRCSNPAPGHSELRCCHLEACHTTHQEVPAHE